jgi:hypothetical protein
MAFKWGGRSAAMNLQDVLVLVGLLSQKISLSLAHTTGRQQGTSCRQKRRLRCTTAGKRCIRRHRIRPDHPRSQYVVQLDKLYQDTMFSSGHAHLRP